MLDYITIDNDIWFDNNKVWRVLEYYDQQHSTGVKMILQDVETNEILNRVVCKQHIVPVDYKP